MEGGGKEEKKGYLSLLVTAVIAQINIHTDTKDHTKKSKSKEQKQRGLILTIVLQFLLVGLVFVKFTL